MNVSNIVLLCVLLACIAHSSLLLLYITAALAVIQLSLCVRVRAIAVVSVYVIINQ
jgi:hypothetical protein